ncbi:MAG: hypothetical protein ABSH20_07365 [Tepidisphaeraceae bacterium]
MRFALAGILFMCVAAAARGQAEGEVELIGFGGWYRPHCWVPMKLRLRPTVGDTETYRIQVIQEDMDRDRVSYSRPFTLNGNRPGERREEQVWVYFRPQPHGLDSAQSPADLTSLIRVFLCKGEKQIVQIKFSAGTGLKSLDPQRSGRGIRLVIGLTTSGSQPNLAAYSDAYGMMEDIVYTAVTANDLPTNPLGFEAVDDLIWDHPDPSQINPDAIAAVDGWVKSGGRMVVCQGVEWQKIRDGPLAAMLPVVPMGMIEEKGAQTLRRIGGVPDLDRNRQSTQDLPAGTDPWADLRDKSIPICLAAARPGARVEEWSSMATPSPYLARWMYGQGMVTWVAQDLGSPAIQSKTAMRLYGWGKIWDVVLGLRNVTMMNPELAQQQGFPRLFVNKCKDAKEKYPKSQNHTTADPSQSFLGLTEIPGRAASLVLLAILFFIGYWLVACLGSYFLLLNKKKTQQSWFVFAVCAVGATGVTALFVRLVLRGPPEMAQVSFVRWSGTTDSRVVSQLGLLVKQDARLSIEMKDAATGMVSTVTPLPAHPFHVMDGPEFLGYLEYDVPVPERSTGGPSIITVPFRSTLKKFQLDWTGPGIDGIDGRGSLGKNGLTGVLKNHTGHDLYQVYIAYSAGTEATDDTLLRLRAAEGKPAWGKGDSLDLADLVANRKIVNNSTPAPSARCDYGLLNAQWMRTFDDTLLHAESGGMMGNRELAFLVLSLFDRIQPRAWVSNNEPSYVIHRWTGRRLDASAAILTGNMVILARADDPSADISPLPVTLEVDGRKMPGKGAVYYQFVVPLDRPTESTPTTQPVEK